VLGLFGRMLNDMAQGSVPVEPARPKMIQEASINDLWQAQPRRSGSARI
jgi:hypothetical protein